MKTTILNASPRKSWNTAELLKSAQKGAESVGSETEFVNLYDLNYSGCRSCLLCKRKDGQRNRCFWKDDLSPLIDRIFESDALIVGSPIYFGEITAQLRAALERLWFSAFSYDDGSSYFKGKINVGIVLTMNVPKDFYAEKYAARLEGQMKIFSLLNGTTKILPSFDTLQVNDYSKFNMATFDETRKKQVRETQFPKDLEAAFQLGVDLLQK
ncbi:MAG: flavodoxin family protein [Thermoguttaceae bacterium]|nr:flavodoxin family protein [Thermoguttaceae bacterium]